MRRKPVARLGIWIFAGALSIAIVVQVSARADQHAAAAKALRLAENEPAEICDATLSRTLFDRLWRSPRLVNGWSEPERGIGVWSNAHSAVLRLCLPTSAGDLQLSLTVEPYLESSLRAQRVIAKLGRREISSWRLATRAPQVLTARIPSALRADLQALDVNLELPDAQSPASLGAAVDARLLGVNLKRAELRTLPPTPR